MLQLVKRKMKGQNGTNDMVEDTCMVPLRCTWPTERSHSIRKLQNKICNKKEGLHSKKIPAPNRWIWRGDVDDRMREKVPPVHNLKYLIMRIWARAG